jgi:hypothetical protein
MTMSSIPLPLSARQTTAIRLAQTLLNPSRSLRVAQVLSTLTTLAFGASMIFLTVEHQRATLMHVLPRAMCTLACMCVISLGLTGASNQEAKDIANGIVDLAKSHGIATSELHLAKGIVATIQATKLVFLATLPLILIAVSLSPSASSATLRFAAVLPTAMFALATGLVVGALSYACAWFSPTRGKSLYLSIIVLPWWLQMLLIPHGKHMASLPALLSYLSDLVIAFGGRA